MRDVESGTVEAMIDATSGDLIRELNEKRKKIALFPLAVTTTVVLLVLLLVYEQPPWVAVLVVIAGGTACWIARMKDAMRRFTVIMYELEPEIERAYERLHAAFAEIRRCSHVWHIEAQGTVHERKYHAGAGTVVRRKRTVLTAGSPALVKTNVHVPLIPVGKQVLAFMPDRLLVFDSGAVGAVPYSELCVSAIPSRFIEDGVVPQDATVVDRTWRYVNKRGGPDRRFRDNRELPICAYDELHFSSTSGLNEVLQLSRKGAGASFGEALGALS